MVAMSERYEEASQGATAVTYMDRYDLPLTADHHPDVPVRGGYSTAP